MTKVAAFIQTILPPLVVMLIPLELVWDLASGKKGIGRSSSLKIRISDGIRCAPSLWK